MKRIFIIGLLFVFVQICLINSQPSEKNNEIQRKATKIFDIQQNTLSNIEFYTSNYGIFSLNISGNSGGFFWPRGSGNLYIFAGGFWFGAIKKAPNDTIYRKFVEITYNPNSGKSWMVPGRIEDSDTVYTKDVTKYRCYFSTDFNKESGQPKDIADGQNWPYWKTNLSDKLPLNSFSNIFINDESKRDVNSYNLGPSFVSDEDIHSVYKDTDLNSFDGGSALRKSKGYPLRLQIEEHIYSWKNPILKDVIVQVYDITNSSKDTLYNCFFAPIADVDIAVKGNYQKGAANDYCRYFNQDECARLGVFWSGTDQGEKNYGFGYIGISLLEAPAVDKNNFLKKEKFFYEKSEQISKFTFRNWNISQDISDDDKRYNFISSLIRDGDFGPGDKRSLISTGPFNLLPGEKTRIAIAYILAYPAINAESSGSTEDLTGNKNGGSYCDNIPAKEGSLLKKTQDITKYYYNKLILDVIESSSKSDDYSIYPNPGEDYMIINVWTNGRSPLQSEIEIYNYLGVRIPSSLTPKLSEGVGEVKIDISNLPPGVYFVRIGDYFEKFVKL
jgi:hypothetical protein